MLKSFSSDNIYMLSDSGIFFNFIFVFLLYTEKQKQNIVISFNF